MRIQIVKRERLNEEQRSELRDRVVADADRERSGLLSSWDSESNGFIFVVLLKQTNKPIGLLYRGGPKTATIVSIWLDEMFRGLGIGNEMIDLFAKILKNEGVTSIADLSIQPYRGQRNFASEKLVVRLRKHFSTKR